MDKLDAEIAKAKKDVADLKRRAELRELELRALIKAAELRPATDEVTQSSEVSAAPSSGKSAAVFQTTHPLDMRTPVITGIPTATRGGRQPGAISKQWRAVLLAMFAQGRNEPHTIEAIELLADSAKLDLQSGSVAARMKNYAELGYVEEQGGKYRVTPNAVERFGLRKQEGPIE